METYVCAAIVVDLEKPECYKATLKRADGYRGEMIIESSQALIPMRLGVAYHISVKEAVGQPQSNANVAVQSAARKGFDDGLGG